MHSRSRSSRPQGLALSLARSTSSLLVQHLGLALDLPPVLPGEVSLSSDLVFDFRNEIAKDGSEEGDIFGIARNNVAQSVIVHDCAAWIADVEKGDCRGEEGVVASKDVECGDVDDGADFVIQLCGDAHVTFELEGRCAGDKDAELEVEIPPFVSFLYGVRVLSVMPRVALCLASFNC